MTICGYDIDDLFSYSTVKIVSIKDRRLGLLHYFFVLLILAYVVGWTLVYQKRYLLLERPIGTVRLSLLEPVDWWNRPQPSALPYCAAAAASEAEANNFTAHKLPCRYWDAVQTLYPAVEASSMFVSTRVTMVSQTLVNAANPSAGGCDERMATPNCVYDNGTSETFFVAQPEDFTVMVDHSAFAPLVGVQVEATDLAGRLLNSTGGRINVTAPEFVGKRGFADILRIGTLLRAAGVDDLDAETDFRSRKPNATAESFRYAGLQLLVFVTYSNTETFNLSDVSYTYEVVRINRTEFKALQNVATKNITNRLVYDRHGIRLMFVQSGELGRFDFQTLLLSVVSGLGLLALSTLVVDVIAIRLMPARAVYKHFKFEETEDLLPSHNKHAQQDGRQQRPRDATLNDPLLGHSSREAAQSNDLAFSVRIAGVGPRS